MENELSQEARNILEDFEKNMQVKNTQLRGAMGALLSYSEYQDLTFRRDGTLEEKIKEKLSKKEMEYGPNTWRSQEVLSEYVAIKTLEKTSRPFEGENFMNGQLSLNDTKSAHVFAFEFDEPNGKKAISLNFRGTDTNVMGWLNSGGGMKDIGGGYIFGDYLASSFNDRNNTQSSIKEFVKKNENFKSYERIEVAGHSYGGTQAAFAAQQITENSDKNVTLTSFGSPGYLFTGYKRNEKINETAFRNPDDQVSRIKRFNRVADETDKSVVNNYENMDGFMKHNINHYEMNMIADALNEKDIVRDKLNRLNYDGHHLVNEVMKKSAPVVMTAIEEQQKAFEFLSEYKNDNIKEVQNKKTLNFGMFDMNKIACKIDDMLEEDMNANISKKKLPTPFSSPDYYTSYNKPF